MIFIGLSILGLFSLIVISIDISLAINEWQSRIFIGHWNNRELWEKAVEKKTRRWLRKTPTIRKSDNTRFIIIDILRGNFRTKEIQAWQDAGLILGLEYADAKQYLKQHAALFQDKEYVAENLLLAFAIKRHNLLAKSYETKLLNQIAAFKDAGTLYYRPWVKDVRFVDTIGMIVPFLQSCGWKELAHRQIKELDQVCYNGVFPPHAFDVSKKLPLGVFDWSRGIGWYILGLLFMDKDTETRQRITRLADGLLPYQHSDGYFSCFLFNHQERAESSGSALIGLLFIRAYKYSQEKRYLTAAKRVEHYLMKVTRRNGAIDYCQGDTQGIGFYSRRFSTMPFAQGMTLLLIKELDNLHEDS